MSRREWKRVRERTRDAKYSPDAARAVRSAGMARRGVWSGVTPEDAERYARERLEDARIIEAGAQDRGDA